MRARYEYEFVEAPARDPRSTIEEVVGMRAEAGWRLVQVLAVSRRSVEIIFERPVRHDIDEIAEVTAAPI